MGYITPTGEAPERVGIFGKRLGKIKKDGNYQAVCENLTVYRLLKYQQIPLSFFAFPCDLYFFIVDVHEGIN